MTTRRFSDRPGVPSVAEWVGQPFPKDAPFQATPEALVALMDEKKVPWHLQELARRLVALARRENRVQITDVSMANLALRWNINRKSLWRWMQDLSATGLITYTKRASARGVAVGLEPLRIALRERSGSNARGLNGETAPSHARDESFHQRDEASHPRDHSSHAQAQNRATTETEQSSEDDEARFHAPDGTARSRYGTPAPLDPELAALIAKKHPANAGARPRPASGEAGGE